MSESLWIIDPDPTSAQALRNAVDLLGPSVETFASVPTEGAAPQAVLIAGVVAEEMLVQWIGELRRLGGNDLLPVTLVGGLESSAQALALGADHYLNAPLIVADLWDHLRRFLNLAAPDEPERLLPLSRGAHEARPSLDQTVSSQPQDEPLEQTADVDEPFEVEPIEPAEDEPASLSDARAADEAAAPQDEPVVSGPDFPVLEEAPHDVGAPDEHVGEDTDDRTTSEDIEPSVDEPAQTAPVDPSLEAAADSAIEASTPEAPADEGTAVAPIAGAEPEPLFGLKQPKETSDLSVKSDKEHQETNKNESLEGPKLSETEAEAAWSSGASGADEGWGTPDESRTPDPSEGADWGSEADGVGWGEPVEQTDGSEADAPSPDAWDQPTADGGGWGTDDASGWNPASDDDGGWGDSHPEPSAQPDQPADPGGWGAADSWTTSQPSPARRSNLNRIGQQLMPPTLKPRAPISALGALDALGLLGLLARCGRERVGGRVTWRHEQLSIVMHLHEGRLKAINSADLDHDVLQAALAKSWLDEVELAGVRHLMQRRHASALSVLAREGIQSTEAVQKLAQETAERILLRCAQIPGGYAEYHPELDQEQAVAVSQVDTVTRIISLAEALTESPLWIALIGGDDAVPALHTTPLPELIPGRAALHLADGSSSLTTLAMSQGTPISDLRAGCLAALVLGQMELRQVGVAVIQKSHRPDQSFERALRQIRSGNYFTVLGLPEVHSAVEVHRAFAARVSLLRLYLHANHPRFVEAYEELEEARDVLLDPDLRAQYRSANPKLLER